MSKGICVVCHFMHIHRCRRTDTGHRRVGTDADPISNAGAVSAENCAYSWACIVHRVTGEGEGMKFQPLTSFSG